MGINLPTSETPGWRPVNASLFRVAGRNAIMRRLILWLNSRSKLWVVGAGLVGAVIVGLIDYLTGPRAQVSILYVLVIFFVAWFAARPAGFSSPPLLSWAFVANLYSPGYCFRDSGCLLELGSGLCGASGSHFSGGGREEGGRWSADWQRTWRRPVRRCSARTLIRRWTVSLRSMIKPSLIRSTRPPSASSVQSQTMSSVKTWAS